MLDQRTLNFMMTKFLNMLVELLPNGVSAIYPCFKNGVFEIRGSTEYCDCGGEAEDRPCSSECSINLPNFKWKNFKVTWHKHIGRSIACTDLSQEDFMTMVIECITSLKLAEFAVRVKIGDDFTCLDSYRFDNRDDAEIRLSDINSQLQGNLRNGTFSLKVVRE